MPSKRKTSRTHIFQRSTRTRSRRSCSQPKGKDIEEVEITEDTASELEISHENDDVVNEDGEKENEKADTNSQVEKTEDENPEIESQKTETKHEKRKTNKTSYSKQNGESLLNGSLSARDCYETGKRQTPTIYKKVRGSRRAHRYKSYSHEMLVAAYKCVKDLKMPVKAAARMFGVPSSTLHNRVQGQVQIDDSILTSAEVNRITERLKNGEGLDDAFADLPIQKLNGDSGMNFSMTESEDTTYDESITESIMEKMNAGIMSSDTTTIKEEVFDPEYEEQTNGSAEIHVTESDDSHLFTSPEPVHAQLSPSQEHLRRSYKRSYKTYSYEQLVAAYLYVKEKKVAVKFAARAFGVPLSTLNVRVQGKVFIDTSIVMNTPGGRKTLPKPNLSVYPKIPAKIRQ